MRRLALVAFVLGVIVTTVAVDAAVGAPSTTGGANVLGGVVLRSSGQVCRANVPCSEPAPGAQLVILRDAAVVWRGRSDVRGRFSTRLPVGSYRLEVRSSAARTPVTSVLRVRDGLVTRVRVVLAGRGTSAPVDES